MTRLRRSCTGQGTVEYIAVVLAVALLLAAVVTAAATLSPPLGRQLTAAVRQGICIVWSGVCTEKDARAAGLAPCPIHVRRDEDRVKASFFIARGAHGNAIAVERRSDGTVSVSFTDHDELGGQIKPGFDGSAVGLNVSAGIDGGIAFTKGKTWDFPDAGTARRFLRRYAAREGFAGEGRAIGREIGLSDDDGPPLPPAHTTYYEAGPYADLHADVSVPMPGKGASGKGRDAGDEHPEPADASGKQQEKEQDDESLDLVGASGRGLTVLGRGRRGSRTTWYVKVSADAAGQLGTIVGSMSGNGRGEAVLEVAFEGRQPVELRAKGSAAGAGALELSPGARDLPGVAEQLRGRSGQAGSGAVEADVALDLRDPANRAAAAGLLRPDASAAQWHGSLRALAGRLDAAGRADIRLYDLEQEESGGDVELFGIGGGRTQTKEVRRFTRGWSLAPGGDLREREDCAEAARPDAVPS